jgi:hypothetical protein
MRRGVPVVPVQGIDLLVSPTGSLQVKLSIRVAHAEDLKNISPSGCPVLVELVGKKRSDIGEVLVQIGHERVVEIRVRHRVACPGREEQLFRNELDVRPGDESVMTCETF